MCGFQLSVLKPWFAVELSSLPSGRPLSPRHVSHPLDIHCIHGWLVNVRPRSSLPKHVQHEQLFFSSSWRGPCRAAMPQTWVKYFIDGCPLAHECSPQAWSRARVHSWTSADPIRAKRDLRVWCLVYFVPAHVRPGVFESWRHQRQNKSCICYALLYAESLPF